MTVNRIRKHFRLDDELSEVNSSIDDLAPTEDDSYEYRNLYRSYVSSQVNVGFLRQRIDELEQRKELWKGLALTRFSVYLFFAFVVAVPVSYLVLRHVLGLGF